VGLKHIPDGDDVCPSRADREDSISFGVTRPVFEPDLYPSRNRVAQQRMIEATFVASPSNKIE
jgi:hypothetical protein